MILAIVEPPVDDFGLGKAGGNRDFAAARFYRLAAQCASRAVIRSKTAARPGRGPNLASLLSTQWRHGRLVKPLTMIKGSLPTRFSLICQTDRMSAGGAAWGFFGESLNQRNCDRARASARAGDHV